MYRSLYWMEGKPFVADMHFIHQAMAPIQWPTTKAKIIEEIGDREVQIGWDQKVFIKDMIAPYKREEYANAHEFYCSVLAYIYK